ncbi:MAG: carboxymethylenebutenolidase [Hyphomicrobiales bacterium]|nr:MAG: carboxymethylenebutenolidase [Hyphomicrobiales bacterium]
MADLTLTSSDGHQFGAYQANPSGKVRGGIVVIQEIFGVNSHIRSICDRLAADGYVAIAPALFDRTEPGFQSGYSAPEVETARGFIANPNWDDYLKDTDAAREAISNVGKIGIVGFCLGGSIAFLAATRLAGFAAASGFYGGRIATFADEVPQCPVQLHYGSEDHGIPMSNLDSVRAKRADCDVNVYEGAGHGFNCDARGSFNEKAAELAWSRTMALFAANVG